VARKKQSTTVAPPPARATRLEVAAERVGTSLGDLMNRRDVLLRKLSDVEQRIADAGRRVGVSALTRLRPAKPAPKKAKTGNRKRKRPLPPDAPLVEAQTRASAADAKGRAAKRSRTSNRSGNR